ncbi:MAG: aminoacetone oxidase family FAD-binding enzyme [Bacteroidia bacterium]|nr:aminoacetone oxidase family FAD-binding enzyme [Bacteroidia bacterium]
MIRAGIIGAGAAGCFCAIEIKRRMPSAEVFVFESGSKPLAKVAVTGGGRCNLTNSFERIGSLSEAYPRGTQLMKRALKRFDQRSTWEWFENAGVPLVLQDDCCVFPASQDAMDVVRTLERKMHHAGVNILCRHKVKAVAKTDEGFNVSFEDSALPSYDLDYVVVTAGGQPKTGGLAFLESLGLEYETPVPSLFTFNIDDAHLKSLMGAVVNGAAVSIPGTKFKAEGPLLVTDWGFSGPAALKLSSYAARYMAEHSYSCPVKVSWLGTANENQTLERVSTLAEGNARKLVSSVSPSELSSRIWEHLMMRAGLRSDIRWAEMGGKGLMRLASVLAGDIYTITGRCHFKGEFVTCGGVSLSNIDINTLESKKHPGLFFAGEVLDVDAVTGGFNLQAAWSMGFIAASSICDGGFSC